MKPPTVKAPPNTSPEDATTEPTLIAKRDNRIMRAMRKKHGAQIDGSRVGPQLHVALS